MKTLQNCLWLNSSRISISFLFTLLIVLSQSHTGIAGSIPISEVQVINKSSGALNNRGDQSKAIDGNIETIAHMTPPFSTGPQIISYNLGNTPVRINRIRVAKIGDTTSGGTGTLDNMNLRVIYSTGGGALQSRQYQNVTGMKNGFLGTELIKATSVSADGVVIQDHHDYKKDGFYSLTFDAIHATAVALEVTRSQNGDSPWVHYGTYEFQASYEDALARQVPITQITILPKPRQDFAHAIDGDIRTTTRITPNQAPTTGYITKEYSFRLYAQWHFNNPSNFNWLDLLDIDKFLTSTDIYSLGLNLRGHVSYRQGTDRYGNPVQFGPPDRYIVLNYDVAQSKPSPDKTDEARVVIHFGSEREVSRLRLFKRADGDQDGKPDKMNIRLLYADGDPAGDFSVNSNALKPVSGMVAGFNGGEKINARIVSRKGEVLDDVHDSSAAGYGFYSLSFAPVKTKALVLSIKRAPGDVNPWVYYTIGEIQAFHHPVDVVDYPIAGVEVFLPDGTSNNRGDQVKAIDDSISTAAIFTKPGSTGPQILAFDLGGTSEINRIRVAKAGDAQQFQGGEKEKMDLEILYTTDSGPLNQRSYRRVTGLVSGDSGRERIKADRVLSDGFVDNDVHDFLTDGYFTLSFNRVKATGFAIQVTIDPFHQARAVHYPTYDISAFLSPGGGEFVPVAGHRVFRGSNRQVNQRNDSGQAIDGKTSTASFLTPSGSEGGHILALELEGGLRRFNRIRVAKDGQSTGEGVITNLDLEILSTTGTGPLESLSCRRIQGLRSGFNGAETISAGRVSPDGRIDNDYHDFGADGYYSLSFPSIEASAVAIGFSRDSRDSSRFSHYRVRDIQVLLEPDGVEQKKIISSAVFDATSGKLNSRGDNQLAHDGNTGTISHLTPPGSTGPHIVAYASSLFCVGKNSGTKS